MCASASLSCSNGYTRSITGRTLSGWSVTLCPAIRTLRAWAEANLDHVLEARQRYDAASVAGESLRAQAPRCPRGPIPAVQDTP